MDNSLMVRPSAIPREQKNVAQSAESMRHSESREHFWRIADGYDLLGDVMEARARRMPGRRSPGSRRASVGRTRRALERLDMMRD